MGVCTSINFNFRYEVEIRFSDNPWQKEASRGNHLAQENKVCNLQIRYYFSKTQVTQLMVSKINLLWGNSNVYGWLFLCDAWLRCLVKLQFMLTETRQISNLRSQDVSKEILSDLARKSLMISFTISSMQLWKCLREH